MDIHLHCILREFQVSDSLLSFLADLENGNNTTLFPGDRDLCSMLSGYGGTTGLKGIRPDVNSAGVLENPFMQHRG